ncbi:putative ribonuclease J [Rubinisphaera italica]|uniref:Putative ribonuclease J n=2 Tax=Rubinisphaera italica TaxID=2527969 RepID=A0A5C5XI33_9PLAN|nr:putative ribonuclease J [Rubinisphaera italica]
MRIVLDIGLPLKNDKNISAPDISGLTACDDSLLGIFISHPHPDHYGLLDKITEPVPVYMGEASRRIIEVSSFFTPLPTLGNVEPLGYRDQQSIQLGPFTITPYRIDHSAFDSHCLLIEAEGKRLFYSGDIRGHGRNSHLYDDLIQNPPQNIDVLICEGTQIGRIPDFAYPDEESVEAGMVEVFKKTNGMGLVWCSSQNIDRLVSVWNACKKSGRQLVLDMYTAEIVRAAKDDALPKPGKEGVTVYLPYTQKQKIIREKAFHISNPYRRHRIYYKALVEAASRLVMIFRPSMMGDHDLAKCLSGASLISSVWSGYVHRSQNELDQMKNMGIERTHIHTSGHATVDELRKFANAIPAKRIVPIHLENREGFAELSERVELKNDHEWWEI